MPRRRRPPRPGALSDLSPTRILTQIVVLQAAFYICAAILLTFSALAAGKRPGLNLILDWEVLRGDITEGWMYGLVWMLNSLICVIFILLLVARSKLVPDFALTIHLLHLFATSLYSRSIPTNVFWWGLQTATSALMTSLGIWSCQWRELRPFSLGGMGAARAPRSNGAAVEDALGFRSSKASSGVGEAYELTSSST